MLRSPRIKRTRSLLDELSRTPRSGPSLSMRAFEFGSVYGLDTLVPITADPKMTVWITACLGTQQRRRQKKVLVVGRGRTRQTSTTPSTFLYCWETICPMQGEIPLRRTRRNLPMISCSRLRTVKKSRFFQRRPS